MKFAVIEVGSTNTKGYIYNNGEVDIKPLVTIEFKNHYKISNSILEEDKEKLYNYIKNIKKIADDIHVFGTSIFRQLEREEKNVFLTDFHSKTGYNFNIVSADEENEYTVYGVVGNIDYKGKLAVMIGGGGSTELAIVEDKKIIEKANSTFGAIDVTHQFPDLTNDIATSSNTDILNYTKSLVNVPKNKADVLVLAGGNYILFYEKMGYRLDGNKLYKESKQPYIIDKIVMEKYDQDFIYHRSLNQIKDENPDMREWWNGARGMRICVEALVDTIDAKYIIPTDISMIYGIIEKIKTDAK